MKSQSVATPPEWDACPTEVTLQQFVMFSLGRLRLLWEQRVLLWMPEINYFSNTWSSHLHCQRCGLHIFLSGKRSHPTPNSLLIQSDYLIPSLQVSEMCWHTFSGEVDLITFTFVKTCSLLRACFRFQCLVLHSVNKCLYWISNLVGQTRGKITGYSTVKPTLWQTILNSLFNNSLLKKGTQELKGTVADQLQIKLIHPYAQ